MAYLYIGGNYPVGRGRQLPKRLWAGGEVGRRAHGEGGRMSASGWAIGLQEERQDAGAPRQVGE